MVEHLLALLNYQDILGVVASTTDGLVVAAAGVPSDDADVIAAASAAFARTLEESGARSGNFALSGGTVHLVLGDELMLVALTEPAVLSRRLSPLLADALGRIDGVLHDAGSVD